MELGDLIHARSGDKGANAYLGVRARHPQAWSWGRDSLTATELARLIDVPVALL